MSQKLSIDIIYDPETKYYTASFTDLPITTQAKSLKKLYENIEEAYAVHIHDGTGRFGNRGKNTLNLTNFRLIAHNHVTPQNH